MDVILYHLQCGTNHSRVCGRVIGYQYAYTSAFFGGTQGSQTIDSCYLTGPGAPGQCQHIWSFAAGRSQVYGSSYQNEFCRCVTSSAFNNFPVFFPNDPLWDGDGCVSSTCCELNNLPWFTKTLPSTTNDNIELRICLYDVISNENIHIEHLIELY